MSIEPIVTLSLKVTLYGFLALPQVEFPLPFIRKERAGSMTKKKPDFLRDLDTAIMDELTGGGIKGNAAGLVGTLTQIKEIKQLCGLPFCGYMAKLETVRPSGVPDEVTVVFAEDVPYRACSGIEFDEYFLGYKSTPTISCSFFTHKARLSFMNFNTIILYSSILCL